MTSYSCERLSDAAPQGVLRVCVGPAGSSLHVDFDPQRIAAETVSSYLERSARNLHANYSQCEQRLSRQGCDDCPFKFEQDAAPTPGQARAHAVFEGATLRIRFANADETPSGTGTGPAAKSSLGSGVAGAQGSRLELALTIVCGVALAAGFAAERLSIDPWLPGTLYLLSYLTGGYFGLLSCVRSLRKRVVDVDLLMILAALGAAYVDAALEGAMLLFLFALSNVLQHHALDRSRKAIRALMKLRPSKVLCQSDGGEFVLLPVEEARVGAVVRIRPGEYIALDGEVIEGQGSVDESSLTGESMPVQKSPSSQLFAGTMNQTASLTYRVSKAAADSTLARIISLVEDAQAQKAKTERFLDKAEQYYAVGVILFTLGLIIVPPFLTEGSFSEHFYRAMTVMVVASPCALIISTPAAFLAAIAGAARRGVLFKGGVHLERLAVVDTIAFDKTGTLTEGRPSVAEIVVFDSHTGNAVVDRAAEERLLQIAGSVESHSEHPVARAIEQACRDRKQTPLTVTDFNAIPGKGAEARIGDNTYLVGSPRLFAERRVSLSDSSREAVDSCLAQGKTAVLVGETNSVGAVERVLGMAAIADTIRPEARSLVDGLKRLGIRRVAMLTGDDAKVAENVARQLGIDEVYAGLLPEDKLNIVRNLGSTGRVAMVGDGVNDAPALASAYVGVAMGAAGTDVAMETADVVLMSSQLDQLLQAVALARQSRRIVAQNLLFSLGVIATLVVAALTIGIPLPLGVVGHEGSTVLVCLNGLRLLTYRLKSRRC